MDLITDVLNSDVGIMYILYRPLLSKTQVVDKI